jgi:uncharacterized protein (TIGR04141 family)
MSTSRELIHLKWYGGSSVLSHLFSQGLVSGELLASDTQFRALLNAKLPSKFKLADPRKRPDPALFTVVFGIIAFDRAITDLPFFSRVNLRSAVRRLVGLGFNVRYSLIPADKKAKVLKKVRPRVATKKF